MTFSKRLKPKLDVPRPIPSWGSMLRDSQQYIYIAWWFPPTPRDRHHLAGHVRQSHRRLAARPFRPYQAAVVVGMTMQKG